MDKIVLIQRCIGGCTRVVVEDDYGANLYVHSELDKDKSWLPNLREAEVVFPEFGEK